MLNVLTTLQDYLKQLEKIDDSVLACYIYLWCVYQLMFPSPPPLVTNDTVKVEVWDIVDKGKVQRKESKGVLKLFNNPTEKQVRESSFSFNLLPELLHIYM